MFFQILGETGVEVEGDWYPITAARQRAAFCLLALAANRPVGRPELVDAIWGDRVPQHPEAALQIVVSRLRTALGPAAVRLVSVPAGYRLDVAGDELDYTVTQTEFIRGRSLLRDNEFVRAADVLSASLAHWPNDVFAGLEDFPFYEHAQLQLNELRASIEENWYEAMLAAGRHIEVLASIPDAIAADPWREQLRRHRMLALYRGGRQVEALREFDEFRALLVDQLGVEPSQDLGDLRVRILDHDASLLLSRAGLAQPIPAWTATSLPWVGRSDEEELIFARLRELCDGGQHMVLVEGEPGIGKTRLVMEIAKRLQDDVILVAATGADVTRGAIVAIAEGLTDASEHLTDAELRICLGHRAPEIAAAVPRIARRFPDLATRVDLDDATRADRLRDGVLTWIVRLSERAPIVLLLDDMQRAGPGLLLFLSRLFARSEHQRVLVLATARSRTSEYPAKLEALLDELAGRHAVDRVELSGLRADEIEFLLSRLGVPHAADRARSLHESTGGHPFFLGEIVHSGDWDTDVPTTVREFVRQRVRNLGLGEAETLTCASRFVTGFDIPLIAEVAGITETAATMHMNRALAAGILRQVRVWGFAFTHELARRALGETLEPERAAQIHRRIAVALERRGTSAALLATHWYQAAGEDARAKAHVYATTAADDALRALDPDTAARWYESAVTMAPTDAEGARALLGLADAQHQAGDPRCVDTLRTAVQRARALDDPDLVAACALAWSPLWASLPPLERDERVTLLEEASSLDQRDETRSLLLARLATEFLHSDQRERVHVLVNDALVAAERSGSAAAKAEVAMRYFHATWCPHTLVERRALILDALSMLSPHDVVSRCFALSLLAAAELEGGDRAAAEIALDELLELADLNDIEALSLNAMTTRCWHAALTGNLPGAARLAAEALAMATHDPTATTGITLQLAYIAWQRGQFAELLPYLEQLDPTMVGDVAKRLLTARALAAAGDHRRAVSIIDTITRTDLEGLSKDLLWSTTLIFAAETAFMLDSKALGAEVFRLLAPFRSRVAVANFVVAPIAYGAGLAAAAARGDDVDSLFDEALDITERLDAPVLRARTEIAWTIVRHARGTTTEGARHAALVDDARAICNELELTQLCVSGDPSTWRLR